MLGMKYVRLGRLGRPMLVAVLGACLGWSLVGGAQAQDKPLTIKVITSSPGSLNTHFTLIMGEKDALLVDAPFLRSDAYRLVADILDTGKTLRKIVVTHGHPDHYFGLDVLKEAFPDVDIIADPAVVADIWKSYPNRLAFWGPRIGVNAPHHPQMPRGFDKPSFELEGHEIDLLGPMKGDADNSTVVYVPSLKAIVCGDVVFNQVYPGIGAETHAQRVAWIASLDKLAALKPQIVVSGHTKPGLPNTMAALDFTREFLKDFDAVAATAKSADEIVEAMKKDFPDATGGGFFANTAKAAVREKQGK